MQVGSTFRSSWHGISPECVTLDFAQKQVLYQISLENSSLINGRLFLDFLNSQSTLLYILNFWKGIEYVAFAKLG